MSSFIPQEPINTAVPLDRHNRHSIAIEIGKNMHTFDFKSGGDLVSQTSYVAGANGTMSATGLYDPQTCTGKVSLSAGMYNVLLQMHKDSGIQGARGATHITHAVSGGQMLHIKHVFANVVISHIPKLAIGELGGLVDIDIAISLSDLKAVENA
jgi:hypothetical protein